MGNLGLLEGCPYEGSIGKSWNKRETDLRTSHALYCCLISLAFVAGFARANPPSNESVMKPNVILILTDDQGYGDIGRHGNPILKTPNMDRLHDQSVRFTDFQVSPCCAPSRCALMTGMHEFKSGVTHTLEPWRRMNLNSITIAEVLKSAGYRTGHFGKWHLGLEESYRPDQRGFDVGLVAKGDSQNSHFSPTLVRNGSPEKHTGFRTDIFYREAMAFIEQNKDEPFFCYLPSYSPHGPHKVPKEYAEPYESHGKELSNFYGMIANIDKNIGLLLDKLKELELEESTLIIFINDNGGTKGVDTWNAGMRGCKGTPWYGGTRAFSFWRWPGTFEPKALDHLSAHYDVLPTVADILGIQLKDEHQAKLDGISLYPVMKDAKSDWPSDRMLFTNVARWGRMGPDEHVRSFAGVRYNKYHLVTNHFCDDDSCKYQKCTSTKDIAAGKGVSIYSENKSQFHFALTPEGEWALYSIEDDLSESQNIADQHPELVLKMIRQYDQWWTEVRPMMIHDK
jgi:arylsulfatase A-like enzyme